MSSIIKAPLIRLERLSGTWAIFVLSITRLDLTDVILVANDNITQ